MSDVTAQGRQDGQYRRVVFGQESWEGVSRRFVRNQSPKIGLGVGAALGLGRELRWASRTTQVPCSQGDLMSLTVSGPGESSGGWE